MEREKLFMPTGESMRENLRMVLRRVWENFMDLKGIFYSKEFGLMENFKDD